MSPEADCSTYILAVGVILTAVAVSLGLLGNLLSFLVLRKSGPISNTIFLLSALSLIDFFFLVTVIVLVVVPSVAAYGNLELNFRFVYVRQYGWAVLSFFHTSSVWTTTLVTLHRYITICKPNHKWTHKLKDLVRTWIQLGILLSCAFIFVIPRFFEWDVEVKEVNGTVYYIRVASSVARNLTFQILYKNILFYIVMYVVPLTAVIFCTVHLCIVLKKNKKFQKSLNRAQQSEHSLEDGITFTLVVVVIVFVVCQTPTPVARLLLAILGPEGKRCGQFYFYFEYISDFLVFLNSSVNFLIYVLCARRFRSNLLAVALCLRDMKSPQDKENATASDSADEVSMNPKRNKTSTASRGPVY